MSTWILVWFSVALLSTLLLIGFALALVRHVLIVGRAARQMKDEVQPLALALGAEVSRAGDRASSIPERLPRADAR